MVLEPTVVPNLQYGIEHANNVANTVFPAQIVDNNVDGFTYSFTPGVNDPNVYKKGIYCFGSTFELIQCNHVNKLGRGFDFEANNTTAYWEHNTMIGNTEGLVLTTNGTIGHQGGIGVPYGNIWSGAWTLGSMFKTFTDHSNAANGKLWVRSGPLYGPTEDPTYTALTFYNTTNGIPGFRYCTFGDVNITTGLIKSCPPLPHRSKTGNGISASLMASLEAIANNTAPLIVAPSQATFINQTQLYRTLQGDTSICSGDSTLLAFVNNSANTSKGMFAATEQALSAGDLTGARNLAGSVPVSNKIESNYVLFYNTYISQKLNGITSVTDSTGLDSLARGCPHIDGMVVFQARALYNAIYSLNRLFQDNCGELPANSEFTKTNDAIKPDPAELSSRFIIYPNPNTGEFFISAPDADAKEMIVTIFDITGNKILEKKVVAINGIAKLDLDIANGMYFVKIQVPGNIESELKKVIISK